MMNRPRSFEKMLISAPLVDWEAVYQAELPRIYNFFLYRTGNEAEAEDLTAATFEKAWRERHRYRRDLAAFSTWLFTIARRVAIDHFRRPQREVALDAVSDPVEDEGVEALTQRHADLERLSALLARLPERESELIALKYGAGLTNRHIARLCGISESNAGTILHRVTQQLRLNWEAEP